MTRTLDLSFRVDDVGGGVVDGGLLENGQPVGLDRLRGEARVILLVHGFNVSLREARSGYDLLTRRIASQVGPDRDWAFGAPVLRVYWPGDADWWIFSPLVYPLAIGKANDTGRRLAALLQDLARHSPGELLVDLMCHSLGNRVAFQALAALSGNDRVRVRRGLHFAAAVPTWQLEDRTQDMQRGLQREMRGFGTTSVHSAGDFVLSAAFPLGESLRAGAEGFMPVALGHEHWPGGDLLDGFLQVTRDELGHGDYWARLGTDLIHDALDIEANAPRRLTAALLPEADTPTFEGTAARDTPQRSTGEGLLSPVG